MWITGEIPDGIAGPALVCPKCGRRCFSASVLLSLYMHLSKIERRRCGNLSPLPEGLFMKLGNIRHKRVGTKTLSIHPTSHIYNRDGDQIKIGFCTENGKFFTDKPHDDTRLTDAFLKWVLPPIPPLVPIPDWAEEDDGPLAVNTQLSKQIEPNHSKRIQS